MTFSRRDLLKLGAAGAGVRLPPGPLVRREPLRPPPAADDSDRVLVLLQMSGGNDGLSTVVPFADDVYHRSRKATRIKAEDVLKLARLRRPQPEPEGAEGALRQGLGSRSIQGAGYPNPNRSHFESMDIWHSADPEGRSAGTGWIGRFADTVPDDERRSEHGDPRRHVDPLLAPRAAPPRDRVPDAGGLPLDRHRRPGEGARDGREPARRRRTSDATPRSTRSAARSARRRRRRPRCARPRRRYKRQGRVSAQPARRLAEHRRGAARRRPQDARLLGRDGRLRHARQPEGHPRQPHDAALRLGRGVHARTSRRRSSADRVVVLAFSEFGRRLVENASGGTDHGVAGPMFAIGTKVKGGLYSTYPSLTALDKGDLKHTVDFRLRLRDRHRSMARRQERRGARQELRAGRSS